MNRQAARRGETVPAGLNSVQFAVWQRMEAARTAPAALPPLDPDYVAGEAYYQRLNRLNNGD